MNWIRTPLTDPDSPATACLVFGLVIALGFVLGAVRIRGVKLGVAGVLFVGIAFGHFGFRLNHSVLEFAREFGLVLFVYTLGLAVGPGFLNALRAEGLKLNLCAVAVVLLGAGLCLLLAKLFHISIPVAVGLYCGATTNTPSLAAATAALQDSAQNSELSELPSIGYAIAYPGGVVGIIIAMLLLKWLLKADPVHESVQLEAQFASRRPRLERLTFKLTNPNLAGLQLNALPALASLQVVVSRIQRGEEIQLAQPSTVLQLGDLLLAVGSAKALEQFRIIVGERSTSELTDTSGPLAARWLTVTKRSAVGLLPSQVEALLGEQVQVTRVRRSEVELPAASAVKLLLGDQLRVVGAPEAVQRAAHFVGDAPKELDRPQLAPLFLGIVLGLIVGSIPIAMPGLPAPLKLGLAGGPLIVALILSQFARIGPLVWYLPPAGGLTLREFGISLFLAAVGLKSGDRFWPSLVSGDGPLWMVCGFVVTLLPLLLVGYVGCRFFKMNFVSMLGLLAGSMTDPPALAFAQGQARSDVPSVAYAGVYPFTMILRILTAQLLILLFL